MGRCDQIAAARVDFLGENVASMAGADVLRLSGFFKVVPVMIEAGDLGFRVVVFTVCAILTSALILYRRPHELGGDRRKARAHAALLCLLWVIYVVLSALSAYRDETGFSPPF